MWQYQLGSRAFRCCRAQTTSTNKQAQTSQLQSEPNYQTIEDCIGGTPLIKLQRLPGNTTNTLLVKLEGNNPAGSVKDRPALSMIREAEKQGMIKPGDTLIEATSGNTGIALAMAAAIKGYRMKLLMPSSQSLERKQAMSAYGAELIQLDEGGMEACRDMALQMQADGIGVVLNQFANKANPAAHYKGTGPEVWHQTNGRITHFVSCMGTTGTIMGSSQYLKSVNPDIKIVGLQPRSGAQIAGIRKWPEQYMPTIFDRNQIDQVMEISAEEANETMRSLARVEGIFAGVSSGGAVSAALRVSAQVENSTIVCIICDRGDRYLSTGAYSEQIYNQEDPSPCDVDNYASGIARLGFYPKPQYVVFTASPNEEGVPWCPDCARCLPIIQQIIKQKYNATLLEIQVGQKQEWKDPQHPFRPAQNSEFAVHCVPTLVRFTNGALGQRIDTILEQTKDVEQIEQIVTKFVEDSKDD